MQVKSIIFSVLYFTGFVLSGFIFAVEAHSASRNVLDETCENLQKIIDNSSNGFQNVRFNGKMTNSRSFVYNTNLQILELSNTAVLIGDVPLYNGRIVNAVFYQAYLELNDPETAKLKNFSAKVNLRSCLPNVSWDATTPSGYLSFTKFLVEDKSKNSEVTVSLSLIKRTENSYHLTLNVVNHKAINTTEANQTSSTSSTNIASPNGNPAKTPIISCNDLSNIFTQSYNSYRNVRFNERLSKTNYYIYDTTLPTAGFQKALVQITKVPLFAGGISNAAHYQAFSVFKTPDEATALMNKFKASMQTCRSNALSVTKTPEGYLEQTKYFISDKLNNSEISIILSMLKGADDYYVSFQVVSNIANTELGIMQNPPTISTSNNVIPSKMLDVCQFIKILSESAINNFISLKGEEIPVDRSDWFMLEKKFKAKIAFSDFENPQIEKEANREANYYSAKMTFADSRMVPFVMKLTIEQIKGCRNLNLIPDAYSSKELYDFRLENQTHSDGFKYDYLVRIQWGEPLVSNSRNLYFKLIPLRKNQSRLIKTKKPRQNLKLRFSLDS